MIPIYISLGSNINREQHIRSGLDALYHAFGPLTLSWVFESEAVGFVGQPFYNLVAKAHTTQSISQVSQCLRLIEFAHGRELNAKKFSPRTLDLDLLLYGDMTCEQPIVLPRAEITRNAFVLWPLAQIAPTLRHPTAQRTMAELWQAYDKSAQQLHPIEFSWQAPSLSPA